MNPIPDNTGQLTGQVASPVCLIPDTDRHRRWCLSGIKTDYWQQQLSGPKTVRYTAVRVERKEYLISTVWTTPSPEYSTAALLILRIGSRAECNTTVLRCRPNVISVPLGGKWCGVRRHRPAHLVIDRLRPPVHYTAGGWGRSIRAGGGGRGGRVPRMYWVAYRLPCRL